MERYARLALVALSLALIGAIGGLAYWSAAQFDERTDWVEHTKRVRLEIASLQAAYSGTRLHWRSYLITGEAAAHEAFEDAAQALPRQVRHLSDLLNDDPGQQRRLVRIGALLDSDLQAMRQTAARKRSGALERAEDILAELASSREAVFDIGAVAQDMQREEIALLEARRAGADAASIRVRWAIAAGGATSLLLLGAAFWFNFRELARRRAAEQRARAAAEEAEDLFDNAPCGYHSVDAEGRIVRMNRTWLDWLGYARDEVVGRKYHYELMTPASAAQFREKWFPLFRRQGWLKEVEFEYVRKDGSTFPGSLQTTAIVDADGRYITSRTVVVDISARKAMERRLQESNAFLDSVIENLPDVVFIKDAADLRFVRLNRAGETLLGLSRDELVGKNDRDLFPEDEARFFFAKDREALTRGTVLDVPEEPIHTRDRGVRLLHTKKIPIRDADGTVRYLLGISEDITERKAADDRIRQLNAELRQQAARLEAANKELESFSYSVSHDLRAPLRAVDGYAQMLEEDYAATLDDEGKRLLSVVRSEAARMGQLIDDLLEFSRTGRQALQVDTVDMEMLVREAAAQVSAAFPGATIEIASLPRAKGDRAMLKQVWLNLIGNGLKYSARRPQPRVGVGGRANGEDAEYWVRDNGAGFDPRYAGKLFGVFQRLHSADEFPGTGVGLAIVQRVVARHGGRVRAEGAVDGGACFTFTLPLAEAR